MHITITQKIVKYTKNFSAPRFERYDTSEPPKTPERPEPFCCSNIAITTNIENTTIIISKMFFIPRHFTTF